MTTAEHRAESPSVRAAPGEGLESIRELAERDRQHELDDQWDDAAADGCMADPSRPDE